MKNCGSHKRKCTAKIWKYTVCIFLTLHAHCKTIHSSLSTKTTSKYSSLSEILKQNKVKSSRMRWVRDVVHMGEKRNSHRFLVRKQEESNLLADLDIGWEVNIKTRQASTYNIIMCPSKNCCSGKTIRITVFPGP